MWTRQNEWIDADLCFQFSLQVWECLSSREADYLVSRVASELLGRRKTDRKGNWRGHSREEAFDEHSLVQLQTKRSAYSFLGWYLVQVPHQLHFSSALREKHEVKTTIRCEVQYMNNKGICYFWFLIFVFCCQKNSLQTQLLLLLIDAIFICCS